MHKRLSSIFFSILTGMSLIWIPKETSYLIKKKNKPRNDSSIYLWYVLHLLLSPRIGYLYNYLTPLRSTGGQMHDESDCGYSNEGEHKFEPNRGIHFLYATYTVKKIK